MFEPLLILLYSILVFYKQNYNIIMQNSLCSDSAMPPSKLNVVDPSFVGLQLAISKARFMLCLLARARSPYFSFSLARARISQSVGITVHVM